MKKNILFTTGISAVAVVAGVSPAIVSATNNQSTVVNVPVDSSQSNPVNPNETNTPNQEENLNQPTVDKNLAVAPKNDLFTYRIEHFNYLVDSSFNDFLLNLFSQENFFFNNKSSFENANQYFNVIVTYKEGSAQVSAVTGHTFNLEVTPVNGKTWENKSIEPKLVNVVVKDDAIADAQAPIGSVLTYKNAINGSEIKNDSDLNIYLFNLFEKENQIPNLLIPENAINFSNVKISYVLGTANLQEKTFRIIAEAVDGHKWSSSVTNSETLIGMSFNVNIENIFYEKDKLFEIGTPEPGEQIVPPSLKPQSNNNNNNFEIGTAEPGNQLLLFPLKFIK